MQHVKSGSPQQHTGAIVVVVDVVCLVVVVEVVEERQLLQL
jgi:hypothetical protein